MLETANFLNSHYAGMAMEKVRERIKTEVESLQGEIAELMTAAVNVSSEALTQAQEEVVISGERNLLSVSDFPEGHGQSASGLRSVRSKKTRILRLLDVSSQARSDAHFH